MNPLTPIDPPEVIETGECPKCENICTGLDCEWICGDGGGTDHFVKCPCGFTGPRRHARQAAADVFNQLTENGLLDDCEHCGGHYNMGICREVSTSGYRMMFKATCECGASGSWERDKGAAVDNHNGLMRTMRGTE